ncbi:MULTISPECIES: transporter substrate-binding domain-containing protein [unclassified Pseudomonas]|uniref:transporter substrate-binding domain-containing protein n=1 Tax=unclassified Pseudomonas TaxID=196821 RepID=UPI0005374A69|nr:MULTISPECIES: transporter substrate-binding domain-containing protein [unclassified Pseudomonas]MBD0683045.1 hybrid sensor histidine kinase/response regulator [Pseudomonas sp. PSB18]CDF92575.1 Hybrid sensory histidine kinase in two-component regulatory system with EvgA [Pseudomonas sp. SHC52]
MRACLRFSLVWFFALWAASCLAQTKTHAEPEPEAFQLFGRSTVDGYEVELDESDWTWLRHKGVLTLGISTPDYPPFDLTTNGHDYEGLTADYAGLIAQLLHVQVRIRRFDSRSELIEALRNREIDFLGTANSFEAKDPGVAMSMAYAEDQPMLVTRNDDKATTDLAGKRIAMLYHYLPSQDVHEFYPGAHLVLYPSTLSAISAVAFGQADVYLGDVISANYLIEMNYLNNIQLADFSGMEGGRFAFALCLDDERLLRIINKTLDSIPLGERMNILRRWGATDVNIPGQQRLHLNAKEQRWIEQHPRVKVTAMENFLPLSFFDENGRFRGASADVLAKISARTGLQFDVERNNSVVRQVDDVQTGKADLIAGMTPSTERENKVRFTRPYLSTPFILVNRAGAESSVTLSDLEGKRVALVQGIMSQDYLRNNYPDVNLLFADNNDQAMAMVLKGEAEAAINTLISARYTIARRYQGRLQMTSTVGTEPARVAFATNRGALELYSILDKALLSISPEEMAEITNRWRNDVVVNDSYWLRNREAIVQGFAIAGGLLLVAFVWIAYLARLIRRRKEAERALSNQLEFMRVLIDGTPHPIYVLDREGRLLICNSGYLDAVGLPQEKALGQWAAESMFADPSEARAYHAEYLHVMAEGVARTEDREWTLADGRLLTIYHWMLPYRDSDDAIIGMIAGWIDVSERQQLLGMVQEANRAKTTFLATMSHEIRTPMNAVIGMLELALKKADQGVLDRFAIEVASGAAHGLLDLIGDILDIARIESGKLSLAPERANLREMLKSLGCIFDGLAQQKHLQLTLDLDAGTDCDVLIDPLRFKQVVSNLLSNAIKFTSEGEVRLSVEVLPASTDEHLSIRLRVKDSGTGISEEDQQQLFSPFSQASNNSQSARSGSGLGLMISRTLCEMMGGRLQLHSVLGEGTQIEVLLQLPLLEPVQVEQEAVIEESCAQHTLTILVVDDYPANRLLLSKQLGYLGHKVVEAQDGAHGLRAWRSKHFDVVITDCNMPIMSGYALARAIRDEEAERQTARCLIIGFTANAQPDERDRCLDAGMDDCLFKPISLKELGRRLDQIAPEEADTFMEQPVSEQTSGIDLGSLEQLVRGDEAAMQALVNDLTVSNQEDLENLPVILQEQDLPALSNLAHKIKGGARIVKAWRLIAACEQMEAVCEARDLHLLEEVGDALQLEMTELAAALNIYSHNA